MTETTATTAPGAPEEGDRAPDAYDGHRDGKGRFQPGNPGGGSSAERSRLTMKRIVSRFQEKAEDVAQAILDAALAGDMQAARIVTDRLAPLAKEAPVEFPLPALSTAADAVATSVLILRAVSEGELTPTQGASVMALVGQCRASFEATEIEKRLTALEASR